MMKEKRRLSGAHARRVMADSTIYVILIVMAVVWLLPIVFLIAQSLRAEPGAWTSSFFPDTWTLDNYKRLFSETYFVSWYKNTLIVAVLSCAITTIFVLMVSYVFSRVRFKMRRPMMNVMLILGMFPGFMSMTAVYFLLKVLLPEHYQSLASLVIVYSAGAALSYYIAKGFFDTIPKSLDEAAMLDGATQAQIFRRIILPMSKSIIIYTILISFMSPWCDYIFVSFIMTNAQIDQYTVALGMYKWLEKEQIHQNFTTFCASAVVVAAPIVILFMSLQRYYVEGVTGGSVKG